MVYILCMEVVQNGVHGWMGDIQVCLDELPHEIHALVPRVPEPPRTVRRLKQRWEIWLCYILIIGVNNDLKVTYWEMALKLY